MNKRIAILGATSHIAKGLIDNFCTDKANKLYLFARSKDRVKDFLISISCGVVCKVKPFAEFGKDKYDVIINCVGIGNPALLKEIGASIFELTEAYDNLILNYLENSRKSIYINFSSGAVYADAPCFYSIAKLNSEAKHRLYHGLKIMDLRVFAYFSRFIDLKTEYLITGIINSIIDKKILKTDKNNIVRDYIGSEDLFTLVRCCIKKSSNGTYDVYSKKVARKFDILKGFHKEFGLDYEISKTHIPISATGAKDVYCSKNKKAQELGFKPKYGSLELLVKETEAILGKRKG